MRNRMVFRQRTRVRESNAKEMAQVGSNQQDAQQQMGTLGRAEGRRRAIESAEQRDVDPMAHLE